MEFVRMAANYTGCGLDGDLQEVKRVINWRESK